MKVWVGQAEIAQLGERQTEDLKVPGSIPGFGIMPEFQKKCFWVTFRAIEDKTGMYLCECRMSQEVRLCFKGMGVLF